MADHLRLAKYDETPEAPPKFVLTETSRDILRYLKTIDRLSGPRAAMICGPSGVGKTATVDSYLDDDFSIWKITCTAGEDTEKHLSETLCVNFEVKDTGNFTLGQRRRALTEQIQRAGCKTLILDDAHFLSPLSIGWVCSLCRGAECNVAFIGSSTMQANFLSDEKLEGSVLKLSIRGTQKADIAAIVRAHDLDRDGIKEQLESIGQLNGHLGKVLDVIEMARAMTVDGNVTLASIAAAISHLGFRKGGK